jgi:hypothetical protein
MNACDFINKIEELIKEYNSNNNVIITEINISPKIIEVNGEIINFEYSNTSFTIQKVK